jgi:sugar phosphate isomerase/epimerase
MQLIMFSKMFHPLSVQEMGKTVRDIGFAGVDLTVRPGGHVLPENVTNDLPGAVRTLREEGLSVPMITTGITTANSEHAEQIIATAAASGVRLLKLGYWQYQGFGNAKRQLDAARKDLDTLDPLAKKHGVTLCLHTHSGDFLTATTAQVLILLANRDPKAFGAYYDFGHMTLEGGKSGWKIGLDLLSDRLRIVAAKGMGWFCAPGLAGARPEWRDRMVPLRESPVPYEEGFGYLKQIGFGGPVSVHSEYEGDHSWKKLSLEQIIEQTRVDVAYLKPLIG